MSSPADAHDGRFQPGRSGNPAGRPPGIRDRRGLGARETAEALGIDPLEVLLLLAGDRWADLHPDEPEVDKDGRRRRVPLELRLKAAKEAAAFLHPRLKAVDHAVSGGGPFADYMAMGEAELRRRIAEIDEALGEEG
jgi:predicted deacylase